jgi:membrane-bound lytic murein transglycosylase D
VMESVARTGGDAVAVAPREPEQGPVAISALLAPRDETRAAVAGVGPDWDLPNLDHERVDYWVKRFSTDKRGEFSRFLSRSGRYVPMISAKLDERGMPQDLIYLAMIESGFNPKAYSPAHASGLWQFISETGRRYGLDINNAVDERNDPVKATDAALDYIAYLHGRFGSWYLAAAGYNSGENRVGRIMREVTGSERGDEYSYYRIWNRLPRETRDYVPLMVAAARIAKDPAKYGFSNVEIAEPLKFEEVTVDAGTPLSVVAEAAGTTVPELRELNPHFKLNRTRNDMASAVRVPAGSGEKFAANWVEAKQKIAQARVEEAPKARTRTYRVRRGDNLTVIARRNGVTIAQLRRANGMRNDFVRAGSVLKIPA